jgi:hypothetical protein
MSTELGLGGDGVPAPPIKVVPKLALLPNTVLQPQIFPGLHGISISFPLNFVSIYLYQPLYASDFAACNFFLFVDLRP